MSGARGKGKGALFSPAASLSKGPSTAATTRSPSFASSPTLPLLSSPGLSSSKRFPSLADSLLAGSQTDSIKAVRPNATRSELAGGCSGAGSPSGSPQPSLPLGSAAGLGGAGDDAGRGASEMQLQLLTKALEESRGQIQALNRERACTQERLAQILELVAADLPPPASAATAAGTAAAAGGSRSILSASSGWPEAEGLGWAPGLGSRPGTSAGSGGNSPLDQLEECVRRLHEQAQIKEVEVAEARLRHEGAATQAVALKQRLEEREEQLDFLRRTVHELEEARHALQHKVGLLESQAAEQAAAAWRRLEEQTNNFKGEAAMARGFQERCNQAEKALECAKRELQGERERARQLGAQAQLLEGQLGEARGKAAAGEKKLWEATSVLADLQSEHQALIGRNKALADANRALETSLADHKERALRADSLAVALETQGGAAAALQACLEGEVQRLGAEMQQEREGQLLAMASLGEAQAALQSLRATADGKQQEIASLLAKLDEYSDRLVRVGEEAATAAQHAAAALEAKQAAEDAAEVARGECAGMRDSLAGMAAAEAKLKRQLVETQGKLGETEASLKQQQFRNSQLTRELSYAKEHIQLMKATLGEQATQLDVLESTKAEVAQQQEQIAMQGKQLQEAEERCSQLRQTLVESSAAKDQADKAAYKMKVISENVKKQQAELAAQLKAKEEELARAHHAIEELQRQAAAAQQQHEAAAQEHLLTKTRNEELQHLASQQSALVAHLEGQRSSLQSQLEAALQECQRLQQQGAAYAQAYARLAAHAGELHAQFARQLGSVLHLCRHLGLHLRAAMQAADLAAQPDLQESGLEPQGQLEAAPGTEAGSWQQEGQGQESAQPVRASATKAAAQEAVAAPVMRLLDSLCTELSIAVQLLEVQSSSSGVAMLAGVPADVAAALQADLAKVAHSSSSSTDAQQSAVVVGMGGADGPASNAVVVADGSSSGAQAPGALSGMCAQVHSMEAQLDRLLHSNVELASKAQAAAGLHAQELAARWRAQELVARLRAELRSIKAERAAFKGQRDLQERLSRELARKLREAAYAIKQLHPDAEATILALQHRSLAEHAVQTQHCDLWVRNIASGGGNSSCGGGSGGSGLQGLVEEGRQQVMGGEAPGPAAQLPDLRGPPSPLPLPALASLIREIYRAKAVQDVAAARGQQPFMPLQELVAAHMRLRHGVGSEVGAQQLAQLEASVQHHAVLGVREVALFGLAAGLLREEDLQATVTGQQRQQCSLAEPNAEAGAAPGPVFLRQDTAQQERQQQQEAGAAAKAALVLRHSRRKESSAAGCRDAIGASLRTFCCAGWYEAYVRSSIRQLAPPPDPARLLHSICGEVQQLLLSTPGVGELLQWVGRGGVAAGLLGVDLGLPVGEDQVPQLYVLAVDSCRLLGLARCTPRLFVKNSAEAAAYYLQVPAQPAFHALNGSLAEPLGSAAGSSTGASAAREQQGSSQGRRPPLLQGAAASMAAAAAAAAAGEWDCAIILTSSLLDLLDPVEVQAVIAGCLGFHAALVADTQPSLGAAASAAVVRPGDHSGTEAERQQAEPLRQLGTMATLGSLSMLCPEALAQRLPPQLAPAFVSRILPVLQRAARYLTLFSDRFSLAAVGDVRVVASSLVKLASGSAVLRDQLNLDAVLQQALALDDAAAQVLPAALRQEGAAAIGAAGSSLTILRIWHLLRSAAAA